MVLTSLRRLMPKTAWPLHASLRCMGPLRGLTPKTLVRSLSNAPGDETLLRYLSQMEDRLAQTQEACKEELVQTHAADELRLSEARNDLKARIIRETATDVFNTITATVGGFLVTAIYAIIICVPVKDTSSRTH